VVISVGATTGQFVDVFVGTATDGPLLGPVGGTPAPTVHLTDSTAGNSFGVLNFGGGVKGTKETYSFVGNDAIGDLVIAGQSATSNPVYIINGASLTTMGANVDVSVAAPTTDPRPPVVRIVNVGGVGGIPAMGWGGYTTGTVIPDSNGDHVPDFAVGELATSKAGRVVVFY
jgi:hypothetical protein